MFTKCINNSINGEYFFKSLPQLKTSRSMSTITIPANFVKDQYVYYFFQDRNTTNNVIWSITNGSYENIIYPDFIQATPLSLDMIIPTSSNTKMDINFVGSSERFANVIVSNYKVPNGVSTKTYVLNDCSRVNSSTDLTIQIPVTSHAKLFVLSFARDDNKAAWSRCSPCYYDTNTKELANYHIIENQSWYAEERCYCTFIDCAGKITSGSLTCDLSGCFSSKSNTINYDHTIWYIVEE